MIMPPMTDPTHDDPAERIRQLEAALSEKDAALREVQHRAKNSLQLVLSLLKLQAGRIRDPEARAAYDQTLVRIEALAILYRQLHEAGSATHVDLGRYLDELCELTGADLRDGATDVAIEVQAERLEVGLYEAMAIGLIVTELLSTSLRHVFPNSGWIRLTVSRLDAQRGRLVLADNGRPLPAGFDEATENGMMLVDALAAQLGDSIAIESTGAGTTATLTFPL